jgi:hypothetical protein
VVDIGEPRGLAAAELGCTEKYRMRVVSAESDSWKRVSRCSSLVEIGRTTMAVPSRSVCESARGSYVDAIGLRRLGSPHTGR